MGYGSGKTDSIAPSKHQTFLLVPQVKLFTVTVYHPNISHSLHTNLTFIQLQRLIASNNCSHLLCVNTKELRIANNYATAAVIFAQSELYTFPIDMTL